MLSNNIITYWRSSLVPVSTSRELLKVVTAQTNGDPKVKVSAKMDRIQHEIPKKTLTVLTVPPPQFPSDYAAAPQSQTLPNS